MTQNGSLKKDDNGYPVMGGTSSVDNQTIINSAYDPVTRRLLTDASSGSSAIVINTTTITGGTTTRVLYDNAGTVGETTGIVTDGTNVTIATGTGTVNKITITPPATGATLTIVDGKTFKVDNSLELAGTDSTVMTFPSTTATIARIDAAQTFTGVQTVSNIVNTTVQAITVTTNAGTADITHGIQNFTNSSASAMTITLAVTSAVDGQFKEIRIYDFSGVAQGITWVNTENSTVSVPATSNGSTTLPLSVLFQYNGATSKWRCLAVA